MQRRLLTAFIWLLAIPEAALSEGATPREEVEILMNEGVGFAHQMLRQHGEFFPYAFAMSTSGEIKSVAAGADTEQPLSQEVLDLLHSGLRRDADNGEIKATAVFFDVFVTPPGGAKTDAVQVALEHVSGYCANVYFPYSRSDDGNLEFGELFADSRDGHVFECG